MKSNFEKAMSIVSKMNDEEFSAFMAQVNPTEETKTEETKTEETKTEETKTEETVVKGTEADQKAQAAQPAEPIKGEENQVLSAMEALFEKYFGKKVEPKSEPKANIPTQGVGIEPPIKQEISKPKTLDEMYNSVFGS